MPEGRIPTIMATELSNGLDRLINETVGKLAKEMDPHRTVEHVNLLRHDCFEWSIKYLQERKRNHLKHVIQPKVL